MYYNLRRLRERFCVSRSLLAKITGIPYRTIQNWELGDRLIKEYEYNNIIYRLSERDSILKVVMQKSISMEKGYCADWFSDEKGYGYIANISGKRYKRYCEIPVRFDAIDTIHIWAQWTLEDLVQEVEWEKVSRN